MGGGGWTTIIGQASPVKMVEEKRKIISKLCRYLLPCPAATALSMREKLLIKQIKFNIRLANYYSFNLVASDGLYYTNTAFRILLHFFPSDHILSWVAWYISVSYTPKLSWLLFLPSLFPCRVLKSLSSQALSVQIKK